MPDATTLDAAGDVDSVATGVGVEADGVATSPVAAADALVAATTPTVTADGVVDGLPGDGAPCPVLLCCRSGTEKSPPPDSALDSNRTPTPDTKHITVEVGHRAARIRR